MDPLDRHHIWGRETEDGMKTSKTVFFLMLAAVLLTGTASAEILHIPYGSDGWKYKVVATGAEAGFEAPGYDDSAWATGESPFGAWVPEHQNSCAINASVVTSWPLNTDILVRRTVNLCDEATGVSVAAIIDNDVQVFWNGVDITGDPSPRVHEGCAQDDVNFDFEVPEALLLAGDNVLAVRGADRGIISILDLEVRGEFACNEEEPPTIDCGTASASTDELWPPNHKYRTITVEGVVDENGDSAAIEIDSIYQDESVLENGTGSGNTCPDGKGVGTSSADVRAERNGNPKTPGDGRVYHINFTATGGAGETCTGTVRTCVPHDQGQGPGCVDGGPLFDSTVCP